MYLDGELSAEPAGWDVTERARERTPVSGRRGRSASTHSRPSEGRGSERADLSCSFVEGVPAEPMLLLLGDCMPRMCETRLRSQGRSPRATCEERGRLLEVCVRACVSVRESPPDCAQGPRILPCGVHAVTRVIADSLVAVALEGVP